MDVLAVIGDETATAALVEALTDDFSFADVILDLRDDARRALVKMGGQGNYIARRSRAQSKQIRFQETEKNVQLSPRDLHEERSPNGVGCNQGEKPGLLQARCTADWVKWNRRGTEAGEYAAGSISHRQQAPERGVCCCAS
jgi:hypothetical protein